MRCSPQQLLISLAFVALVTSCQKSQNQDSSEISRKRALALGEMEARDRASDYFIAAPHGDFDAYTYEIVESFCDAQDWDCLGVHGYRTNSDPINVNRPTEGIGMSKDNEVRTDRASFVYQEYLNLFNEMRSDALKLYVEIHGNKRRLSRRFIEVAHVGLSDEQLQRVKEIMTEALNQVGLADISILTEGEDGFHYHASSNKAYGILTLVEKALHIEFPMFAREHKRRELEDFLNLALPRLAAEEFP